MRVTSSCKNNLEIIELLGELTGEAAFELQDFLYNRLEQGKHMLLIDFKQVRRIDGLGIYVLENIIKRGVFVRLCNMQTEVWSMLKMANKDNYFRGYITSDNAEAISAIDKKLSDEKTEDSIRKRKTPRVVTFLPAEFKYHPGHNGVLSGKGNILNLSEGGMLVDNVSFFNTETGTLSLEHSLEGVELFDLGFKIENDIGISGVKGRCVRESRTQKKISAGISFDGIQQEHKQKIRDFVYEKIPV